MNSLTWLFVGSGILLAALSVPLIMGKIPPNGLFGTRILKTMKHSEIWYPANRFAGWHLLVTGLVTALAALLLAGIPGLSVDEYAIAVLAVLVIFLTRTIFRCISYLRE